MTITNVLHTNVRLSNAIAHFLTLCGWEGEIFNVISKSQDEVPMWVHLRSPARNVDVYLTEIIGTDERVDFYRATIVPLWTNLQEIEHDHPHN